MTQEVSFRGISGRPYGFTRVSPNAPWARHAGVAIFAASDAYGWRVIRIVSLTGRDHDIQPIWAYADAERYGARAVFIRHDLEPSDRKAAVQDLEAGLNPVCSGGIGRAERIEAIAA